jgi:hypothetical protein
MEQVTGGEDLPTALANKYEPSTRIDRTSMPEPRPLAPTAPSHLQGTEEGGQEASESTPLGKQAPQEEAATTGHVAISPTAPTSLSDKSLPQELASKELSTEIGRKYEPKRIVSRSASTEPQSPVQPLLELHRESADAPAAESVFPPLREDSGLPTPAARDASRTRDFFAPPPGFHATPIQRKAQQHEAPPTQPAEIPAPIFVPSQRTPSQILSRVHEPLELVTPKIRELSRKATGTPEIARAPLQRDTTGRGSEVRQAEGEGAGVTSPDAEALAREVYTIIKRRLVVERERLGSR